MFRVRGKEAIFLHRWCIQMGHIIVKNTKPYNYESYPFPLVPQHRNDRLCV